MTTCSFYVREPVAGLTSNAELEKLQRETFGYFLHEKNPDNGLVVDKTASNWKPESGFLPCRWDGYNEALLLYLLGLGSPAHPLPAELSGMGCDLPLDARRRQA